MMSLDQTPINQLITDNIDTWTSTVKTKATTGRGSSKKLELDGVKKLRELILELAVRGKLVPQDPSDEPASVLLERIAAEKAQLVKDKKIKKQKTLPEITDKEAPFSVPKGWEWTRLGNLSSDIHYGYTASAKPDSEGVRLLRITDIQNDKVNWATVPACDITDEKAKSYLLENNDILIARTGGTIGKSYLVENIDLQAVFASYLIRVKRIKAVYAPFTKVFLGSQLYWKQLFENSAGTGQPNVNATALKQLLFIMPPFEQQKRIVAKVDELMTLCDQLEQQTEASIAAHQVLVTTLLDTLTNSANAEELMQNWQMVAEHFDTLFTTEESVDQLKQTVLQLAVMGKLVPQDPEDEPAAKLLERIAEEKALLIKDKKIKKQKVLPPITDDEKPFELPSGWEWCRFGNVAISRLGKMLDKSKNVGSPLPYLRNTNVQWHKFDLDDVKLMKIEDSEREEFLVLPGDLLICEGGEPGRCAIWKDEKQEIYFQKALHRARPLGQCLPEYLQVCLTVDAANGVLDNYFTGATIKHFVGAKLNNYIHPLPPVHEQKRIVDKINDLITICDQLKCHLKESQVTQRHLTDAIVEQAV